MAGCEELGDFCFVGCEGGGHGLLGVVVCEFSEVERSGWEVSEVFQNSLDEDELFEVSYLKDSLLLRGLKLRRVV